jgi:hypothetical protein
MENETMLEHVAQETARHILHRYAPDYLDRPGLRDAIVRLARQGIESSLRLYRLQQQQAE